MSVSGDTLGTLIYTKMLAKNPTLLQLEANPETMGKVLASWQVVGNAICEFLSLQQVITTPTTLTAPGAVTLANGGGPALGAVVIPPITGNLILP